MLPHTFSVESQTFVELCPKVLPNAEEIDILLNSSATSQKKPQPAVFIYSFIQNQNLATHLGHNTAILVSVQNVRGLEKVDEN